MKTSRRLRTALLSAVMVLVGFCYGVYVGKSQWLDLSLLSRFRSPETSAGAVELAGAGANLGSSATSADEPRDATADDIDSLGYLAGYEPAAPKVGVVRHDAKRAYPGVNFYTTTKSPTAHLMDMDGNNLHTWSHEFSPTWPKHDPTEVTPGFEQFSDYWRHAHLLPDGDVLAIYEGCGLIKLDRDSNLLWAYYGGFHHDLDVGDDGRIFVLSRRQSDIRPYTGATYQANDDTIVELAPDGTKIRDMSILRAFANSRYASLLKRAPAGPDPLHTNAVQVLDGSLAEQSPAFRKGNVLISARNIDMIAVVDLDLGEIVWVLDGMWRHQHASKLLENGNLLVFDNLGNRGFSKVIEFNPFSQAVAWTFEGNEQNRFRCGLLGFNQRLPNGNTLITDSMSGRAFEATPDRKIVWEFVNPQTIPERIGRGRPLVAALNGMVRFDDDAVEGWLDSASP